MGCNLSQRLSNIAPADARGRFGVKVERAKYPGQRIGRSDHVHHLAAAKRLVAVDDMSKPALAQTDHLGCLPYRNAEPLKSLLDQGAFRPLMSALPIHEVIMPSHYRELQR